MGRNVAMTLFSLAHHVFRFMVVCVFFSFSFFFFSLPFPPLPLLKRVRVCGSSG